MAISETTRALVRRRLAQEVGRIDKSAPHRVALAYPSPYFVGMSSLGFQRIYDLIQAMPEVCAERVFLPDGADRAGTELSEPAVSYESLRGLDDYPLLAFSVAYELELAGLVKMLDAAGIGALRSEREDSAPLVLAGGPLTFSNPRLLAPFADVILVGEAEGIVEGAVQQLFDASGREQALDELAKHPHLYVPSRHHSEPPPVASCDKSWLPAKSVIRTPDTELSNMFLIEAERGCSRGCTYCVMRRTTAGGMRLVPAEVILDAIPEDALRVGLVGAAVSDHPKIVEIVQELAARGKGVGLSSLRPNQLKEPFVAALKAGGYRTLTTALDGASERLRDHIDRRGRRADYELAAENARKYQMDRLKLYLMIGLPGETDEDIDECIDFVGQLSRRIPIVLGIAPFCAKKSTPLDGMPFAGVDVVQRRLRRLKRGLRGRADIRSTSARWAWVEHILSQGAEAEAEAVVHAVRSGGKFAHYRRAFEELGHALETAAVAGGLDAVPRGEIGAVQHRRRLRMANSLPSV